MDLARQFAIAVPLLVGLVGVVLAGLRAILTGALVPARTHERETAQAVTLAKIWQSAYEQEAARTEVLTAQLRDLTEASRTTLALLETLNRAVAK